MYRHIHRAGRGIFIHVLTHVHTRAHLPHLKARAVLGSEEKGALN